MAKNLLFHVASRVLNVPLMVTQAKLSAILAVLGPRIGLDVSPSYREAITDFSAPQRYRQYTGDGIGLIPVYDTLVFRSAGVDAWSGLTAYEDIRSMFFEALDDPSISDILFDVGSPGGEVSGVFDLVDDIYRARGRKPIYAIANESALSAAYAIASGADKIFIPRTGIAGSIGVRMVHVDQSGFNEKTGLAYTTIFAGARKNDFSPNEPLSDEALSFGQGMVDEIYDIFVNTVARNRRVAESDIRATEAGIYQGENAVKAGLADGVMNFDQVVEHILSASKGASTMKIFGKKEKPPIVETDPVEQEAVTEAGRVEVEVDLEQVKQQALDTGLIQGRSEGAREANERAVGIIDLCAAADPAFPFAAIQDLIREDLTTEQVRVRVLEIAADRARATDIVSTVSPTSTGGKNPLIAEAERRAEAAKKGAK